VDPKAQGHHYRYQGVKPRPNRQFPLTPAGISCRLVPIRTGDLDRLPRCSSA